MRRFIEENIHLASPPVVRPPAPPPQPWDGPRSQWKVPDHLSMPHPKGGYMAMALMSRTMDDLDEVTGGKRAATYEEVDKYFGHALIAEGLVPFTYTADEAIGWWKAGGFRTLGKSPGRVPDFSQIDGGDWGAKRVPQGNRPARSPIDVNFNGMAIDEAVEPSRGGGDTNAPPVQAPAADMMQPTPQADIETSGPGKAGSDAYRRIISGNGLQQRTEEQDRRKLLPEAIVPFAFPFPRTSFKSRTEWVTASRIEPQKVARLSGRDILATPEIRAAAQAAIGLVRVRRGHEEKTAYGYLMPDGTIQVRLASGGARAMAGADVQHSRSSGQGKVIFMVHGHIDESDDPRRGGSDGMVDDLNSGDPANQNYGDTMALAKAGIPIATVYRGAIGWHEMVKGQLVFTAPASAVTPRQMSSIQRNLDTVQEKFLKP